jgi:hypothetical protein
VNDIIKFTFKSIKLPNKSPMIKINDQSYVLDETFTEIDHTLSLGQNLIKIEFLNKTNRDTKVINGKIVEDLAVVIEKIDYKGYNLITHWDLTSSYVTETNEQIKNTHGFLAFKGTVTLDITSPVFLFLRDLTINNG